MLGECECAVRFMVICTFDIEWTHISRHLGQRMVDVSWSLATTKVRHKLIKFYPNNNSLNQIESNDVQPWFKNACKMCTNKMWSFAHFFSIKSIEKVQRQYILCFTLSTQELPATCFRQVGMAIQKTGKVVMLQKHPFGTPHSRFTGNRWWYHDWVSNWHTWKAQSRARTEWGLRNTLRNIWLYKGYHYMAQEHFICIVPNKTYPKNCTETWEHTRSH